VLDDLRARGVRADLDDADDTIGKRIRNAELDRIPFVVVFGEREAGEGTLSVRARGDRSITSEPREAALDRIARAATL
jgi:threonyl-tRNA synthetase